LTTKFGSAAAGSDVKKCHACGKTVYKQEEIIASTFVFHKPCFKCSTPGCGTVLTTLTFHTDKETQKVYCPKHKPTVEMKFTGSDSIEAKNAQNAPKQNVVSSSNIRAPPKK